MKALKIVGISLLVLILIFLSFGFLKPEIAYESEVVIEKPIEEVWAIMQDESRINEWLKEVKKIEHISGEKGKAGAESKIYVEQNGEEMFMVETINSIEEQDHMECTFTMDFMTMDYRIQLEDLGGKTRVTSKSVTTGNGMMAKSMLAFMGGAMEDQENLNMTNLKTLVENNTVDYFPEETMEVVESDSTGTVEEI
ncbi:SRPBCC family protein [Luteibaculum oceani]|uniref:SRPBCC family protein n=1 Tax=Luteibaculum oceani TaxID=1294296 RepID=A0A5C6V9E1_9FLAO|nr:SRPBCC family protein [Luteibaculum oceani]TXC82093.1 SRPBCC family protein [Luteibaculum oceani]